jgi:glyoxylase-like metal-dependent hydrolase (beta-lactamase superfamily II)
MSDSASVDNITSDNLTRIRRLGIVNVFLLQEEDGLTVIDTAIPGTAKRIVSAAGLLNQPIKRIVLTHAHDDHVGSLDALKAAVPDAEVIMTERDARIAAGDKSLDRGEPQDKLRGGLKGAETKPDRHIADGDMVGSLRVISTPGHTPGHIALFDTRDNTLFCGDVFSTLGGMATSARANPLFPLPALATWHKGEELASARKLLDLEISRLAPGHGRVVANPIGDMRLVAERAERAIKQSKDGPLDGGDGDSNGPFPEGDDI